MKRRWFMWTTYLLTASSIGYMFYWFVLFELSPTNFIKMGEPHIFTRWCEICLSGGLAMLYLVLAVRGFISAFHKVKSHTSRNPIGNHKINKQPAHNNGNSAGSNGRRFQT